jgi:hypothetical protein
VGWSVFLDDEPESGRQRRPASRRSGDREICRKTDRREEVWQTGAGWEAEESEGSPPGTFREDAGGVSGTAGRSGVEDVDEHAAPWGRSQWRDLLPGGVRCRARIRQGEWRSGCARVTS